MKKDVIGRDCREAVPVLFNAVGTVFGVWALIVKNVPQLLITSFAEVSLASRRRWKWYVALIVRGSRKKSVCKMPHRSKTQLQSPCQLTAESWLLRELPRMLPLLLQYLLKGAHRSTKGPNFCSALNRRGTHRTDILRNPRSFVMMASVLPWFIPTSAEI